MIAVTQSIEPAIRRNCTTCSCSPKRALMRFRTLCPDCKDKVQDISIGTGSGTDIHRVALSAFFSLSKTGEHAIDYNLL